MEKEYQYHIFSPYRVCPIGAHVDHQHGLVTGFAINKGVDLWFNVTDNSTVKLSSKTFEGDVEFEINQPSQVREHHWGDYARGAKYALRKRFELKRGITGVIQGSLPVGGLSSSAAVLIAYVMAFAKANDITLQPFEVVKIASEAEREYIGLNNGLLDQACIALGKKDGLLFLDCDSDNWRIIKRNPEMPEFEIGIFFSGLTRSLVNSDYNLRVYECKRRLSTRPSCAMFQKRRLRRLVISCLHVLHVVQSTSIRSTVVCDKVLQHGKQVTCSCSENSLSQAVRAVFTITSVAAQNSLPSMR